MRVGLLNSLLLAILTCLAVVTPPAWASSLFDTTWRLVAFQSMSDEIGTIRPHSRNDFTMALNADGTVNLKLDCNRANGSWQDGSPAGEASGSFRFGPLMGTRALCRPPNLDERILRDADYVRSYLLEGDRLHLSLMADAGIYTWERVDDVRIDSPENGGPRSWTVTGAPLGLNLRSGPSTSARVIGFFEDGARLSNLDCRQEEDRAWCDVQRLSGGPRGFVAADYLTPTVGPDGSIPIGIDDSPLRAGQLNFDATGFLPCAQRRGQPMSQCPFSVARSTGGYATVVVERPDRTTRAIYFWLGEPAGADTSQADGYPPFTWSREGDLNQVRVGEERYEIPDAVVLGG